MADPNKLTAKQQRFVDAYDGNATDAARKAGYKGNNKTLEAVGRQNLAKPRIASYIQNREKERTKPNIATREERQQFWTDIMRGEGDGEGIEMQHRLKAVESLAKSEGDFIERRELTGKDGGPLQTGIDVRFIGDNDNS